MAPLLASRRKRRWLGFVVGGLVVAWLGLSFWWLFGEPAPSVADNGDYWRIARPAGLEHVEGARIDGTRPSQEFRLVVPDPAAGWSSPVLLARTARAVGARGGQLDIRWVGGIHLLLLVIVCGVGIVLGARPALAAAALLVLCDAAYLPFFNSFYAEAAILISLAGTATWLAASGRPGRPVWVAFGVVLVLLASLAKPLYAVFGVVVLAAVLLGGRRLGSASWLAIGALALAATAGPLWFGWGPGPRFVEVNRYHAIFAGFAVASPDPERALASLGVPVAYHDSPRTDVFRARLQPDDPVHEAIRHVSRPQLLFAYLAEPAAVVNAAERVVRELAAPTSHTRAISPTQRRHRPYELRPRDLSSWRAELVSSRPVRAGVGWLALVSTAMVVAFRRSRPTFGVLLFLVGWGTVQGVATVVGDGFVSLRQHLVAARYAIDLAAVIALLEIGTAVLGRRALTTAPSLGATAEDPKAMA